MEAFPSDNLAKIIGASNPAIKSNNIVINKEEQTIYLPVRGGSNLANFDPDFNTLPGVSITPEGAQDFSNGPVSYTVVSPPWSQEYSEASGVITLMLSSFREIISSLSLATAI